MTDPAHALLDGWENFYVIVGSSAAALTGLQFVVIALVAESRAASSSREIDAFGTPTIVHFCAVLLVSAILSAPWDALSSVAVVIGACGVAGLVYAVIVTRRARATTDYRPVLEDWIWHSVLPLAGYGALTVAAILLTRRPEQSFFVMGATALLLLFVGIHNAWDTVTYIAIERFAPPKDPGERR
jgi:hypothetical protein